MACVYWIHHPSHTDIMTQGYIGFTSQKFSTRKANHKGYAQRGKQFVICRAIRKYGYENLIKKIIVIGTKEYCLDLEKRLRPRENIGWNIGIGGKSPWLGRNHTDAAKRRMSASMKGKKKSPEARINIGLAGKGRVATPKARKNMRLAAKKRVEQWGFSETHRRNISKAKKGICTCPKKWLSPQAIKLAWLLAPEIYKEHLSGNKRIKIEGLTPLQVYRMRQHFRAGWNPNNDLEYLKWKHDTSHGV